MKLFLLMISLLVLVTLTSSSHAQSKDGPYHESTRFALGGEGGWDYLLADAEARRLYIARNDRIMVIDPDSGKSMGEIKGLEGAHGVALVKELNLGFATSGKSGEVVAFDLKTLTITGRIKAGDNPDAIIYDSHSKKVFAFNGKSQDMTPIDTVTLKPAAAVAVGGKPEFAVSDGNGKIFVNIEDKNELLSVDAQSNKIIARYPLKPCEEPTGLSMDIKRAKLIVGCGNKLALIVDAKTGSILQHFEVGDGVDATAFDSKQDLAFISAGEGRLTILVEEKAGFRLLQDLVTEKGARTLAVDQKTGKVFLPVAKFTEVPNTTPGARPKRTVVSGSFSVMVEAKK